MKTILGIFLLVLSTLNSFGIYSDECPLSEMHCRVFRTKKAVSQVVTFLEDKGLTQSKNYTNELVLTEENARNFEEGYALAIDCLKALDQQGFGVEKYLTSYQLFPNESVLPLDTDWYTQNSLQVFSTVSPEDRNYTTQDCVDYMIEEMSRK